MSKLICAKCMQVHDFTDSMICPTCHASEESLYHFKNSDTFLKKEVPRVIQERKDFGLDGLIDGLDSVVINTEPHLQVPAATELIRNTGLTFFESFQDNLFKTIVLSQPSSASFLIQSRKQGLKHDKNPFFNFNINPKSKHLPNTRLETFVFKTKDIKKYVDIQKNRGVNFLTDQIIHRKYCSFIQTIPSKFTGNSLGFIQWNSNIKSYKTKQADSYQIKLEKPKKSYIKNIKKLDHTATRVRAIDRDSAIIEFMELTNYRFDFAIYVKLFNSITNVARLSSKDFAMVFTSGVIPYKNDNESGPTEKFIHNYGTRVHHMAFQTENIEETFIQLKQNGIEFLIDLVGSKSEGLKQTFSKPSPSTLLVNEYIHRYGDFDGFFTKSNVTKLTEATEKQ